jgi:16S rRNA G966 N2-methylase RsmD
MTLTEFILQHTDDDIRDLALHKSKYPEVDMNEAIIQISGRQKAKHKLPTLFSNSEIRYPVQLSMEQCSSEQTAKYKASLISGKTIVDLTGGFGIDSLAFAEKFEHLTYVEQNAELCQIMQHNCQVLKRTNIEIRHSSCLDFLTKMPNVDATYIDPARRDSGGNKIFRIQDCEPNLLEIADTLLSKSQQVMIKLSPMLDITQAIESLPKVSEIIIVSVENECKELLIILDNHANEITYRCTNFLRNGEMDELVFSKKSLNESRAYYINELKNGGFLYEPNTSLLKSGAYNFVSEHFNVLKIAVNSHLYFSENLIEHFHGRTFQVTQIIPFNKRDTKILVKTKANITTRNFPITVAEIRKRYNIKEGGDTYIFATTLSSGDLVFIMCKKLI